MHELVKIADASITGLEKCHQRIIGYSERISKLVAKYRIIVFFFKYLTKNVIIGLRWNPGNNLLLSLLPHFRLEPRLAVTPPICYLPLDLAAPNVNVSRSFHSSYKDILWLCGWWKYICYPCVCSIVFLLFVSILEMFVVLVKPHLLCATRSFVLGLYHL